MEACRLRSDADIQALLYRRYSRAGLACQIFRDSLYTLPVCNTSYWAYIICHRRISVLEPEENKNHNIRLYPGSTCFWPCANRNTPCDKKSCWFRIAARFYSISGSCAFSACNGVANGGFILYYSKKEVGKRTIAK